MSRLNIIKKNQSENKESKIKTILAIAAGKGGVGKSTVSVNLALALKEKGYRVGLLDADVYGPSLEQMIPCGMEPVEDPQNPEKLLPALAFGIPFISVAHFKREATIVRAPIANSILDEFLHTVEWGELDFLLIDFPPGTGDIQLTLMQKACISAAILVTTPQAVATLDVRKALQLFLQMGIPILGVVENMSYFEEEGKKFFPFGSGGGQALAKEFAVPFLGAIPIDSKISEMGDLGESLFEKAKESLGAKGFEVFTDTVLSEMKNLKKEEVQVREKDSKHVEIFLNGEWHALSLHEIQKNCPCARCSKEKKSDPKVALLEFSLMGRYALKITFSSGCSRGIYPFSLLKKMV